MMKTGERKHNEETERANGGDTKERHGGGRSEARMGEATARTHDSSDETARPVLRPVWQAAEQPVASAPSIVSDGRGGEREAGNG